MPQEINSGGYSNAYRQKLAKGTGGTVPSTSSGSSGGGGLLGGLVKTLTSPLQALTGGGSGSGTGTGTGGSSLFGGSNRLKSDQSINQAIGSMDKQLANVGVGLPNQTANTLAGAPPKNSNSGGLLF